MDINLDKLTEDELLGLNRRIVERLKLIRQHSTLTSMIKFEVGQRVSFDPDGRARSGVLIKFNPKTVVVLTDDGLRWKVSPQFLRPLLDASWRRLNIEPPCRSNTEPGRVAEF
ncbi:MAG: hypothetical protein WBI20_05360 [Burkholderiaceae bacterium]